MHEQPIKKFLIFIIVAIYFIQGAVGITAIADFILTKNAFTFSWIQIAMLSALSTLAWSMKPIYGFLTDLVPIFGSRRKYYLVISSLLSVFGYYYLGLFGTNFLNIAIAIIVFSIGLGFSDVIVDGMIVENVPKETVGKYQALTWRAKAVGIFIASLFSGYILERGVFSKLLDGSFILDFLHKFFSSAFPEELIVSGVNMVDIRFTFFMAGTLSIISLVLSLVMRRQRVTEHRMEGIHHEISLPYVFSGIGALILTALTLIFISSAEKEFFSFIANDQLSSLLVIIIWSVWIYFYTAHLVKIGVAHTTLLFAALFLFLWRFTPSFGAPWSDYFINTLKLPQEKIGLISSILPISWFIGSIIYTKFIDKIHLKKVLFWTVIFASILSLSQLALATPDLATAIGGNPVIKYFSAIILYPSYFFAYNSGAWGELMTQSSILNLEAFLSFFLELMFIIAFLPLFKLAAVVTPKGVEATNFAVLMSIMNLGLAFGSLSGGMIYTYIEGDYILGGLTFSGLHITILIGAVTSLLCLLVLRRINVKV